MRTNIRFAVGLVWLLLGPTITRGEDIYWVGDQATCDGRGYPSAGSFHSGNYWLNYFVPGHIPDDGGQPGLDGGQPAYYNDRAIFDSNYRIPGSPDGDSSGTIQKNPRTVYFGDVVNDRLGLCNNDEVVPAIAGPSRLDWTAESAVRVRSGVWIFDFGSNVPSNPSHGDLVTTSLDIGTMSGNNGDILGDASLTVRGGGQLILGGVSASNHYLARDPGTTAVFTVTDNNTALTTAGRLVVGQAGDATFVVQNGAAASMKWLAVGELPGSSGIVRLTGASVEATMDGVVVGGSGTAVLRIENGARMVYEPEFQNRLYIGLSDGSNGVVVVSGAGSTIGPAPNITVGGIYHTDTSGHGRLEIINGGSVDAGSLNLGDRGTSSGEVLVSGAASRLNIAGTLAIGEESLGTMTVENGAAVVASGTLIGDVGGNGTATITGGSTWTSSTFRVGRYGRGTMTIAHLARVSAPDFAVGKYAGSNGTLVVSTGGILETQNGRIGQAADSIGTATVDGSPSRWTSTVDFLIGDSGQGELIVSNGATVTSPVVRIGETASGMGEVTVRGAGSSFTASSNLRVGYRGVGALTVENSAVVSTSDFTVGRYSGGRGTVSILSGGQVTDQDGFIAREAGSTGNLVTVSGAGSRWTNTRDLNIGTDGATSAGQGILEIESNGIVTAANRVQLGSQARIRINGGSLTVGGGSAATTPNVVRVRGAGQINLGSGIITIGGVLPETVANTMRIRSGSKLLGSGSVAGRLANSGTVAPGEEIGLLSITAGFAQDSTGDVLIDIAGTSPAQYDRLAITGSASFDGDLIVSLANGYVPSIGAAFSVISYTSRTGTFDNFSLPPLPLGRVWGVSYGAQTLTLSVTQIPGDINLDGLVNHRDLAVFTTNFGRTTGATWQTGDFDADGRVGLSDLSIMQSHFGESPPSAPQGSPGLAVSEPASFTLFALGTVGLFFRRRRPFRDDRGHRRRHEGSSVPLRRPESVPH